jgi:hypothetical protein
MKKLVLAIAVALSAPAALADTLADQVKAEAARLLVQVKAADATTKARPGAKPAQLAPALTSDLQRFSLAASRLSSEIDQRGGPKDLRCIFRGMAEETGVQLKAAAAAKTNAEQSKALARLTHMLSDAVEIAPAVGGETKTAANLTSAAASQCEVLRDF